MRDALKDSFVQSWSLDISPRVLPSIPSREITYQDRADVFFQVPGSDAIIDLLDEESIEIRRRPTEVPRASSVNIFL